MPPCIERQHMCVCVCAYLLPYLQVLFVLLLVLCFHENIIYYLCLYFTNGPFYSHFTALFLICICTYLRPRGASQLRIALKSGRLCCLPTSFTKYIHTYTCGYISQLLAGCAGCALCCCQVCVKSVRNHN